MQSQVPDAINASPKSNFSQIPNEIIRSSQLSATAAKVLMVLLSNSDGWKSCRQAIVRCMAEGKDAVDSALKQLEQADYLRRYQYRDKRTKKIQGKLWAYTDTPGVHCVDQRLPILEELGWELVPNQEIANSRTGKSGVGSADAGQPATKNTKGKNTKSTNITLSESGLSDDKSGQPARKMSRTKPPAGRPRIHGPAQDGAGGAASDTGKGQSIAERNAELMPVAERLRDIVQTYRRIHPNKAVLRGWTNEIRKLIESEGVERERIDRALDWYADNANGEFVPVIESGAALRNKFAKLEAAIERDTRKPRRRVHRRSVTSGAQPAGNDKWAHKPVFAPTGERIR